MDRRLVGERTEFGSPAVFQKKSDSSTSRMTTSSEPTKTTTSRYVHFKSRSPERIERSMRRRLTKGFVAQGK